MLLGSKPLADMSEEEMQIAIEELQGAREALRADAIARIKRGEPSRAPRVVRPKVVDNAIADILRELMTDE
jgi:hypothetical protein